MERLSETIRVLGLALAVVLAQACQQAEQPVAEEQSDAPMTEADNAEAGSPETATASTPPTAKPSASPAPSVASKAMDAPSRPAVQTHTAVVPAGTAIRVRTTRTLSTQTLKTGDGFDAVLDEAVMADGHELFPRGATVMGTVVSSDPGGRVKGVATMAIALTMLHTSAGQMFDVDTSTVTIEADTSKAKDAAKVGIGTAVGAAIGAIAGGKKGAGIGAATGAGAGTAVVLGPRGDAAEVPAETVLTFSLTSPLSVVH
jgi:cytoskeletal protein RodZ